MRLMHMLTRRWNNLLIRKSSLFLNPARHLKEIKYTEKDDVTVIEGVQVKSPREGKVIKGVDETGASCPLCKLGLKNLVHTDILILSQFIYSNGEVIPTSVTGLCKKQHLRVSYLVKQAQLAGLLPRADQQLIGPWELNNTYFKTSYGR